MTDLELAKWIKNYEGLRTKPYQDSRGHLTIGWGRNLEDGIHTDEAELMFHNDLIQSIQELSFYSWYLNSPLNVQQALINMNFNLGINKLLEFVKMIAAISQQNWTLAAKEALDSDWAKQVGQRAKDIALMMRQGNVKTGTNFTD